MSSSTKSKKVPPTLSPYYLDGTKIEVGVDEAGQGCYLGPVYAGACIWDPEITSPLIRDSKDLTHRKRLIAFDFIKENAIAWGVGCATPEEIDKYNINQAKIKAMYRAIEDCGLQPQHLIIDGDKKAYGRFHYQTPYGDSIGFSTIVKGDSKYYSIAAASIVAKTSRDLYIEDLCDQHSYLNLYNIRSNKGYGASKHEEAMAHWGVTPFHRMSYAPCQKYAHIKNNFTL